MDNIEDKRVREIKAEQVQVRLAHKGLRTTKEVKHLFIEKLLK